MVCVCVFCFFCFFVFVFCLFWGNVLIRDLSKCRHTLKKLLIICVYKSVQYGQTYDRWPFWVIGIFLAYKWTRCFDLFSGGCILSSQFWDENTPFEEFVQIDRWSFFHYFKWVLSVLKFQPQVHCRGTHLGNRRAFGALNSNNRTWC